ncbi:sterol desaturase family protein [Legionella taurinensis]|uniref:Sterol desaturase family protein n=1 Tax=Legionella taurinensis TaxID=70611 RepID=A0A3A5LA75_9GAMM|nr:sterol desaturase family protein [Legionella taurinensis]RJT48032.1 sterol desaturase family protein [Legionella taurinensis]RJT68246.1 sterol desaturase family protein [Legionella taurinensis]STY25570.1 sterol desaturase-related protein [Legionella taurinensis]
MGSDFIVYAIPVFFLLMGMEYVVSKIRRQSLYEIKDYVSNLSSGSLEQLCTAPLQVLLLWGYHSLYQNAAFMTINPRSVMAWIVLWLAVDFLYYWYHRATHRMTLLWMGHSVHHQSEHYNLSVALRQGVVQTLFSPFIYLPLALIGFPTWMFVTVSSLITLYQFWIHTQAIGRLGWFEKWFNTPSHHRVHHGRNPQYIDKNYGGSLILWDKLFNTFEPEREPPDYGVTEPLQTWNSFYANIKVAMDMMYYGQFLKTISQRLALFIQPPEKIISLLGNRRFNQVKRESRRYQGPVPVPYLLVNALVLVMGFTAFLAGSGAAGARVILLHFFSLMTIYLLARVCNGARTIHWPELARALVFGALLLAIKIPALIACLGSLVFFGVNKRLFANQGLYFEPRPKPLQADSRLTVD